jgi:chromate transporter
LDDLTPPKPPATLGELFTGFFAISYRSFGGVMPWAYRVMVEERRWLSESDFAETVGLCQFLPGPNIGNSTVVLGKRWFGLRGALVAAAGFYALPFVWVLAMAMLYSRWASSSTLSAIVTGVGVAGAGLFIATAIKLGRPLLKRPAAIAIAAGCFLCAGVGRVSLLLVIPVAVALAVWCARRDLL